MKKKWSIVLACLIISVCVCNLAACSGGETETHTHTPCNICGLCTDSGCPGASSERCPGHTVTPPVETPELKEMGTYFSGVKTVTARDTLLDENGVSKSFDELLDRQIDVLAQDLIYRLTYVYGYNETTHNRLPDNSYDLKNLDETPYSNNGKIAKIQSNSLITDIDNSSFNPDADMVREISLTNGIDFQKSLMLQSGLYNYLNYSRALSLVGAIEGMNTIIADDGLGNLSLEDNDNSKWSWTSSPTNYNTFGLQHKNNLKYAIAQILCEKEPNGSYIESRYRESLSEISYFNAEQSKEAIIAFIYNDVIGNSLIENDNEYAAIFRVDYNNMINATAIMDINNKTSLDGADSRLPYTGIYNPRLYKGYNIVIPAIVEQALSNTFENTDVSIYPSVSRNSVSVSSTFTNLSVTDLTQGIVLMPKANTPMTKLAVAVQGQAGQTATLSLKAVIGGTEYPISQSVTFTGEKQTVEIDLSSVGKAMGAYNGNTQSYTDNRLFGNTDLPDAHGDNYILLNLSGANGNCTLSFNGLYDK